MSPRPITLHEHLHLGLRSPDRPLPALNPAEELAKIREAYFTLEKAQNSLLHEVVTDRVRGPKVLQYMIKNARAIGAEPMDFATMWRPDSEGSEDGSDGGNEGSWEDYMCEHLVSVAEGVRD